MTSRRPPGGARRQTVDSGELVRIGQGAGLSAVGVCAAEPWGSVRTRLEEHRSAGLSDTMAFTLRNPARSSDPSRVMGSARSLVVGAWPYGHDPAPAPEGPGSGPYARVARYAASDHYGGLRTALGEIAGALAACGWRSVVMCDDNSVVDREAAWRAGLGWYGKNSNILLPGQGSWFVLGSIVTDAPLDRTGPPVADGCGSCRRCIDGCPTEAIVAPGVVDARRCLSWLLQRTGDFPEEFRVALGDRIYGCDDCQEVCPPNRRDRTREATGPVELTWLDVCDMLALDDAALLERCRRWYIPGRDPSIVRRNLLVVLGNTGDPADRAVDDALAAGEGHHDPMIRRHATWARARLAESSADGETARS